MAEVSLVKLPSDECHWTWLVTDIGKSTGPRSSTSENIGGPMKTLSVPVLLSGKKNVVGSPSMGILMLEKN